MREATHLQRPRRPPSRFCSRACKDIARHRERRAAAVQAAGERRCVNCQTVIPETVTLKARFCSRACGYEWHNRQRAETRQAQIVARRGPCPQCGDPVPADKSGRWKYCSPGCKKRAMDARWRERSVGYNRLRLYGIDALTWDATLASQNGRCAICGTADWPGKDGRPHADHCHKTSRFRGILCDFCNRGLGMFADDPARLRAAADYLENEGVLEHNDYRCLA